MEDTQDTHTLLTEQRSDSDPEVLSVGGTGRGKNSGHRRATGYGDGTVEGFENRTKRGR